MDPLCRPISDSQPRLATLRVTPPPRSRNTTPADLQQSDSETEAPGSAPAAAEAGEEMGAVASFSGPLRSREWGVGAKAVKS